MQAETTIGFVGAGNMAAALIGGLIKRGRKPDRVVVFDPDTTKTDTLRARFSIEVAADNAGLLRDCDVVVLAVKPQVMHKVLAPLAAAVPAMPPLIVSIAAGIRIASIEKWLGRRLAVVRVMPNTPSLVGAGASGLYANELANEDQRDTAESLMRAVGIAAWVADERQLDTVTGLSGSGPAYFMLFMQAMVEGAVERGLARDTALALVIQTCRGAAELAGESKESLEQLRINVTSPGGTTERGLETMRAAGIEQIIASAVKAAADRGDELATTLAGER
ncbi:MAG: pyrroline-5-carboxylate reductase [Arenicellales bacterium]